MSLRISEVTTSWLLTYHQRPQESAAYYAPPLNQSTKEFGIFFPETCRVLAAFCDAKLRELKLRLNARLVKRKGAKRRPK